MYKLVHSAQRQGSSAGVTWIDCYANVAFMREEPMTVSNENQHDISRRGFLRAGSLAGAAAAVAACAPAAAPASDPARSGQAAPAAAPAKAAWEKEWDTLVEAAKKEKEVAVITYPGSQFRKFLDTFEAAFPGIMVQHTAGNASAIVPKIIQERQGGVYSQDLMLATVTTPLINLRPANALEPVRPLIFRGDVIDDKVWSGGFEAGFLDKEKRMMYAPTFDRNLGLWINTDQVGATEISGIKDLLNPKWKGKILSLDPRSVGVAWNVLDMKRTGGEEFVRKLYGEQEPVLVRDLRQGTEFMVKGQYPIGIGVPNADAFLDFEAQGLGKNLKFLEIDGGTFLLSTSNTYRIERGPHPNAAKLFINWLFTKEGQTNWAKFTGQNSRRTDGVPPGNPRYLPTAGRTYPTIEAEAQLEEVNRIYALTKEVIK
ncbi:MAG: extracellular solute-binding protein [Dehalococcoidia bacterium]|nr:extracellular solute-binding protein [Dehalococcoidia bacterium]